MSKTDSTGAPRAASDEQTGAQAVRRGRRLFLLIALVFLGPLVLSWIMFFSRGADWQPAQTVNNGELLQPVVPLGDLSVLTRADTGRPLGNDPLHGVWTVVVMSEDGCGEACRTRLQEIDKVRMLLGRDNHRVQRVLLSNGAPQDVTQLMQSHPGLVVLDASGHEQVLGRVRTHTEGALHITDPLGNLVMRYTAETDGKKMMEDLKRMMKLSRIG